MKRVELWPRFCRLFIAVTTVRQAARVLGIQVSTSFTWRHRLLRGLVGTERVLLQGRISVGATWFRRSDKGSRHLGRPPYRSRSEELSFQTVPEWVIVACAHDGRSFGATTGPAFPGTPVLRTVLKTRIGATALLDSHSARRPIVRRVALALDLPTLGEIDDGAHDDGAHDDGAHCDGAYAAAAFEPEPAGLHILRLRRWLTQFHGVATRYLENYLVWFRLLNLAQGRWKQPRPLAPLLLGAFP